MRLVISAVLAATLAAGAVAPALAQVVGQSATSRAYMVEPFTPDAPITIQGSGVRLRAAPYTSNDSPVLSSGSTGLQLNVVGIARQADWNWYQVILRNGQRAFIRSDLTSAPSRGSSTPTVTPRTVQPPTAPPVIAYTPPPTPLPAWQPQPQPVQPQPQQPGQALPPIPTQPLGNGAISLTPGAGAPLDLPRVSPAPAPIDNGLISIAPSAPTPHLSNSAGSAVSSGPTNISEHIRAQLDSKRCWTDSSNMMDAQRLRATFAVSFSQNGRFAAEPRLVQPTSEPGDDPAMMVFLAKARAAMRTCNAQGFDVPADYFSGGQGEVRLDFSAR